MSKCKRYTKEEDDLIISVITNSQVNVQYSLSVLATKLKRTKDAISMRWYVHLSKRDKMHISVVSRIGGSFNRKNVWRNKDGSLDFTPIGLDVINSWLFSES